jgi:REP element-mobilizing transposase RayT
MDGLYHVVSRVVDKRMIFGGEEKRRFRSLLVAYGGFSGIEVVAWCLMDNHFHLLLHVPSRAGHDPSGLPEEEVLRRLRLIYKEEAVREIERVLGLCADAEGRRRYLEQFTRRMGDLPMFMRTLKQRFSRWYNLRQNRKGTLWEDRYRSVVVEIQGNTTLGHAARIVAAYIDLNPVRAGLVEDPAEYAWCGYGRAVVGEKECVRGVTRLWGGGRGEAAAMAEYRVFLFEEGSEEKTEDNKTQDTRTGEMKARVGIDARKVWEERERGGRLPMRVMLRLKSRYLVDGAAIGGAEFLRRLTGGSGGLEEESGGAGEKQAATPAGGGTGEKGDGKPATGREGVAMRFGQWGGLRVLRDLRVRVVG